MVEHMKALDKDSNEPLLKKLKSHLMNMLHHDNNVRVTTLAVRAVDMMRRYGLSMFMRNQVGVVVVVVVVVVVAVVVVVVVVVVADDDDDDDDDDNVASTDGNVFVQHTCCGSLSLLSSVVVVGCCRYPALKIIVSFPRPY